ncbi:MAG TPA: TonB-dependent receptor plug domain-containing protein, partial [Gemmatimonadales bacterium]|nr:TonB-dependent receptor plug domain-containing protein [Gemmatimonadales bacterium]
MPLLQSPLPMKRLALVAWCVVAPWAEGRAQGTGVLYGSVADTLGRPLAAVVRVAGAGGTAAGADGRYRLSTPAGRIVVRVSHIGFEAVVDALLVPSGDSLERNYRLRPVTVELAPLIVTAAKRSQLLDQAVTSVAVVSDSDVARRAVSTVDEAVNRAAGVQFLSGQVNIRGSTGFVEGLGSRVLMLVDGVPVNEGDRGGIDWDIVPLADVAHVEVVKGAGSGLYGSAALGGVVN